MRTLQRETSSQGRAGTVGPHLRAPLRRSGRWRRWQMVGQLSWPWGASVWEDGRVLGLAARDEYT